MSLYYETADILTASNEKGGSLRSRIFSNKNLKSQPAQIYALAIETCKWSIVLKDVIEHAGLLSLERKVRVYACYTFKTITNLNLLLVDAHSLPPPRP